MRVDCLATKSYIDRGLSSDIFIDLCSKAVLRDFAFAYGSSWRARSGSDVLRSRFVYVRGRVERK